MPNWIEEFEKVNLNSMDELVVRTRLKFFISSLLTEVIEKGIPDSLIRPIYGTMGEMENYSEELKSQLKKKYLNL